MSEALQLYSYWRSSAAYRVRIGLNLKGLRYDIVPVHLLRDGGDQRRPEFRAINPQGLIPVLQHGNRQLRQSLAILEYLDETWPEPALLPVPARDRQRVRAMAMAIACDIHPLGNLRVLQFLENEFHCPQPERDVWVRHWIGEGFDALEAMLGDHPATGRFCEGDTPTIADCCLVPQVYSARRFELDVTPWPALVGAADRAVEHPAFVAAHPNNQPDAKPA